jgi:glucan phosphoethanolaminetransferase (alkaline phosphatase superfamily)
MAFTLPFLILRAVQALFAIIVLGTAAYVTSQISGSGTVCDFGFCESYDVTNPGQVDFILFDAIWSLLVLGVVAVLSIWVAIVKHPIVTTVLDGLTMIFWFAGAIALAVLTGVADGDTSSLYQTLQACVAFAFFSWAAFLATFILDILTIMKGESYGNKESNN